MNEIENMNGFSVNVPAIEQALLNMGFPHLERKSEDKPFTFIGTNEAREAMEFIRKIGMPIEVQLNTIDACVLIDLLNNNPDVVNYYGVQDCAETLSKAIYDEKNKDFIEALHNLK